MGALWSLLFGRNLSINGETYRVVRRIGEGGSIVLSIGAAFSPFVGFSYVDLVRGRNGEQFALVSIHCCLF